ncbi:MAG: hypothetical protein ABIN74_00940 [Ferruginibacter sp.]
MKTIRLIFIGVFLISCSKDLTDNSVPGCDSIIEVLSFHPNGNPNYQITATFTFDQSGRIKNVKGEGLNKSEYNYYKDSIVLKATDINGIDISEVYYLDNLGRVSRTKIANKDFEYNAAGYLIAYKQAYGNNGQVFGYTQYYLKYENGNITEVYTNENVSRKKVTLQYYNEINQDLHGYNSPFYASLVIGDRNTFFLLKDQYFGTPSKNLLKSTVFNDITNSGDIIYQYDLKGRITMLGSSYKFNYQCP